MLVKVNKGAFLDALNEYIDNCIDFENSGDGDIDEPHDNHYEDWFEDYTIQFNRQNPYNKVSIYWCYTDKCYVIRTIRRFDKRHPMCGVEDKEWFNTTAVIETICDAELWEGHYPLTYYGNMYEDENEDD